MTAAEEQVLEVVQSWGPVQVLGPLEGGNRNTALLVELNGESVVAKTTRRSEASLRWLHPVLERAERAGFVVPRLLPDLSGRFVVNGVTVETFLQGERFPRAELGIVGPIIRRFHLSTRGLTQRPGFRSTLELVAHDRGGDVDLNEMPEGLAQACREAWRQLRGSPVSVVHGDLNPDNLLLVNGDDVGLVDWDEARVDVSLLDEAALAWAGASGNGAHSPAQRALLAWELAASWRIEPEYSRKLSEEFMKSIGDAR